MSEAYRLMPDYMMVRVTRLPISTRSRSETYSIKVLHHLQELVMSRLDLSHGDLDRDWTNERLCTVDLYTYTANDTRHLLTMEGEDARQFLRSVWVYKLTD